MEPVLEKLMGKHSNRVYIINEGNKNYDGVLGYGEPIYVTKGFQLITQHNIAQHLDNIHNIIEGSHKDDYVVLHGPALLIVLFTKTWLEKHGVIKTLTWNRFGYTEVTLL